MMKAAEDFTDFPESKVWYFNDFHIIYSKRFRFWWFFVDTYKDFHIDNRIFSSYEMCFRAARKWMRDNQNLIYGKEAEHDKQN